MNLPMFFFLPSFFLLFNNSDYKSYSWNVNPTLYCPMFSQVLAFFKNAKIIYLLIKMEANDVVPSMQEKPWVQSSVPYKLGVLVHN